MARLCEGLPIFYNSPVQEIAYGEGGVEVHAGGRCVYGEEGANLEGGCF